jgi:multidrug resistance efflux pump
MPRKWVITAIVVLVIAGAAAAAFVVARKNGNAKSTPTPVQTRPADSYVSGSGVIHAVDAVKVGVSVDGYIEAFHVEVGAEVTEGQILAEIRNEASQSSEQQAASELERAQDRVNRLESLLAAAKLEASRASADASRVRGEFDRAARNYERQKVLIAEGATPRKVYDKAEADYKTLEVEAQSLIQIAEQAESRLATTEKDLASARKLLEGKLDDLESAKAKLAAGQLVAPVGGIVSGRRGQPGDEVSPAMEDLFQIARDISTLQVTVELSAAAAAKVQVGQTAVVSPADMPDVWFEGAVKTTENGKPVVVFANPNPDVKPGATAQVRIKVT